MRAISWLPKLCMGTSGTPVQYVIVDLLGQFFYWTRYILQQCTVRQYHSDLSDQSAIEIGVRINVRLIFRVALFSHFSRSITKTSTLSFF